MELWLLLLYAVASFLALQSLVSLMTHHKRAYASQYLAEELARRKQQKTRQRDGENKQRPGDAAAQADGPTGAAGQAGAGGQPSRQPEREPAPAEAA
ncbi:MAG TPA: hypothetical protein EYP14_14140 [Planctomycetaceae bacterium]|nr:hypothetical protein [Planctomycetaceae bacterium]